MKMIVFSGLPGTGKSTLADALGRHLHIPVFAKDWLEAALLRCELAPSSPDKPLGSTGYQLLTTLAERQLMLGQSVILDSVASTQTIRDAWKRVCKQYQADWRVIECICSDETLHRKKLSKRERKIPGWHELHWLEVVKDKAYFVPWEGERLILDLTNPFEENLAAALAYCE
jgi:predicted kinase